MHQISIDIETYSSVNLAKSGAYPYAASSDFELLLFGYAVDFGPVKVIDLTKVNKFQSKSTKPSMILRLSNPPSMLSLNASVSPALLVIN